MEWLLIQASFNGSVLEILGGFLFCGRSIPVEKKGRVRSLCPERRLQDLVDKLI
jgi:hypothetical protein